jgi:hypothetical protein
MAKSFGWRLLYKLGSYSEVRLGEQKPVIIVTGSSEVIGYAVCEALVDDGFNVMGFDRPGVPHPPPDALSRLSRAWRMRWRAFGATLATRSLR